MSINIGRRDAVVSTPLPMPACVCFFMPIVCPLCARCVLMYELLR